MGTLDREKCTHFSIDFTLATDQVFFSHTGDSDVYLTGYRTTSLIGYGDSSGDGEHWLPQQPNPPGLLAVTPILDGNLQSSNRMKFCCACYVDSFLYLAWQWLSHAASVHVHHACRYVLWRGVLFRRR